VLTDIRLRWLQRHLAHGNEAKNYELHCSRYLSMLLTNWPTTIIKMIWSKHKWFRNLLHIGYTATLKHSVPRFQQRQKLPKGFHYHHHPIRYIYTTEHYVRGRRKNMEWRKRHKWTDVYQQHARSTTASEHTASHSNKKLKKYSIRKNFFIRHFPSTILLSMLESYHPQQTICISNSDSNNWLKE
jgi:hypothetical protein